MIDPLVAGTTGPPITVTFTRRGVPGPVDLTGCTVVVTIQRSQLVTLTKTLTILTPATSGQAQIVWAEDDLAIPAGTAYTVYYADFEITQSAGWDEIQPTSLAIPVRAPLT